MSLVCLMISQDHMIKTSRDFCHKEAIEKKQKNLQVRPKTALGRKTRRWWRLQRLFAEPLFWSQHCVKFSLQRSCESGDIFQIVTCHVSHGKWAPCLVWCPWVFCKWRNNIQCVKWLKTSSLRVHANSWVGAPHSSMSQS